MAYPLPSQLLFYSVMVVDHCQSRGNAAMLVSSFDNLWILSAILWFSKIRVSCHAVANHAIIVSSVWRAKLARMWPIAKLESARRGRQNLGTVTKELLYGLTVDQPPRDRCLPLNHSPVDTRNRYVLAQRQ